MGVKAVVGLQSGYEGKGQIISYLAKNAEIIIRAQGGDAEGQTVVNENGKFILHMSPCGIFNPDCMNIISPGAVINFDKLQSEMAEIEIKCGERCENLFIDKRVNVILPYHIKHDGNGTKQCYIDKILGYGITAGDLLDGDYLKQRLSYIYNERPELNDAIALETLLLLCNTWRDYFSQYIIDTSTIIRYAVENDSNIIIHGQNGTDQDLVWGSYPNVEPFSSLQSSLCTGSGIPSRAIEQTIGVAKAYLKTHINRHCITQKAKDEENDCNIGHFDAIAVDQSCYLNGVTSLAITHLNDLDNEEEVKICTGYMIEGEYYTNLPDPRLSEKARPIYETLPGWLCSTSECKTWSSLPKNAQDYIKAIEEFTSIPISYITVGMGYDQIITK